MVPSRPPPPPLPPPLPALMQTALFIRRNPPLPAASPPLPFADELKAAAQNEEDDTLTAPVEDTPSTSPRRCTNFSSLPAEIRHAIWTESLPRRVIGLRPHQTDNRDSSAEIPYGKHSPPGARASTGSRMPQPMAGACYESRAVVTRSGRWTIGAEGLPVWFDPKRDIILLNSRRPVDYFLLRRHTLEDPQTPTDPHGQMPPPAAATHGAQRIDPTRTVTIADLAQHQLVGCLDEAVRSGGSIAVKHDLLRSQVGRVIFPLLERCAAASSQARLLVYFDEIAITGTRAQAVASGLFGGAATPEEQMFFVPLSDRETLQRIHALSKVQPSTGGLFRTRTRNDLRGSLGGLRIGNAGFIRELLRPSHSLQNLHMLAMRYLVHTDRWRRDLESEPSDLLLARALEEGMPPLEQVILFRFKEEKEGEGSH